MSRRTEITALRKATPVIVPSLLMCDFGHLADEIKRLEAAGVKTLHLDVMDGHFVPNLSYGLPLVETVRKLTRLPIETHLMIEEPELWVERYHQAGADLITIHVEATSDPLGVLKKIRSLGAASGLALNPKTPVSAVAACVAECDVLLAMSVEPGFGGQAFEPLALEKLRALRALAGPDVLLEVDGGVNSATIADCARAGAQLFVVGSAIFKQADYAQSVASLARLATL